MEKEKVCLRVIEPFTVRILDRTDSKFIVVKLPEQVKLEDGSKADLSSMGNVYVDISSKINEQHNIRRDVRSAIRSFGLLVSCKQQHEMIEVLP
jgi:hypothetical protein